MLFELSLHSFLFKIIFMKITKNLYSSYYFWVQPFPLQIFYVPLGFFFISTLSNSSNFILRPINT